MHPRTCCVRAIPVGVGGGGGDGDRGCHLVTPVLVTAVFGGVQVMTEVPQDQVELNLLKTGLGSVTQSDVEAAALADASIFAFNVGGVPADVKVGMDGMRLQCSLKMNA